MDRAAHVQQHRWLFPRRAGFSAQARCTFRPSHQPALGYGRLTVSELGIRGKRLDLRTHPLPRAARQDRRKCRS